MQKSTVAVGIIAILSIAYIGTSWYTGNIIENNINQKVTELSQQINNYQDKANITISYSDYQKGIFSTKLHLMITASDKQEVRSSEAPTTIFNDDITIHHGPFPMAALSNGTFSPQMAWIEYEMSEKVSPKWWKLAGNQPFITGHIGISYQEYLSLNIVNKAINIAGSTETDCQNLSIYDSEDLKDDNEGKDCILDISAGNFSFESNKNFTHLSVNANLDKFSYEQKEWEAFSLNKFNFSAQTNHEKTGIRYQFNLEELNTDTPGYHSMSRLTVDNMTSQGNITYAKNIKLQIAADNIIFIPDIFEFPSLNINQFTLNQNSLFNSSPNRIDGELNIKIGSFLVGKQNLGNGEFDFDFQDVDNQFLSERLGLTNNQDNKVKENDQVNMKISLNKFNWQNSVGDININALYNFSGTRESIRNIGIDNVDVVKINIDMPLNVLIQLRAQLENPLSDTVTAEELNQVKKSIPMISEFVKNSPFLSFKKGDVEGIYSEIDYAKERDKISINGQEISKDKFFNEHPITR